MSWEFSIGWVLVGMLIIAAGAAIVVLHRKIAYGMASGLASFDNIKLFGIITIIVGLLITANLHTLILSLFVDLVFRR